MTSCQENVANVTNKRNWNFFLLARHATAVAAKLCLQIEEVRIIVVLWKRFRIQSILSRYIGTLKF